MFQPVPDMFSSPKVAAAHGNKQKLLTNLSDQVHTPLEFEVVSLSCPPPKIAKSLTYPIFEDLDTRSALDPPKDILGVAVGPKSSEARAGCGWCGDVSGCDMNPRDMITIGNRHLQQINAEMLEYCGQAMLPCGEVSGI